MRFARRTWSATPRFRSISGIRENGSSLRGGSPRGRRFPSGSCAGLVNSDLVALFNTTNLNSAEDLSIAPEVRKSILNFGFPDLARRTIDEQRVFDIAQEIETALSDFEPRLARDSIKVRRDNAVTADELRIRFLISAELRVQPVNLQMEFVAEVELESGKIKVDRL